MRAPFVPGVVVSASVILTALALLLYLRNRAAPGTSQFFDPVAPAVALTAPAVGWAIASLRRPDATAWLLCAGGLVGAAFFAEQYAVYGLVTDPGALPGATWMAWFGSWAWMPGLLPLTTLLLLLFPGGRLGSARRRGLALVVAGVVMLAVVSTALDPDGPRSAAADNPAALRFLPQLSTVAESATGACILLLAPLCLVALVVRWRRLPAKARSHLRWFVGAAALVVAATFVGILAPLALYQALGVLGLVGLSGGILVAAVKGNLYDIHRRELDLLQSRAIVYAAVVVFAAAVYAVVLRVLHVAFAIRTGLTPLVIAVLVVIAVWRPLRTLVSDVVERLRSRRRAYEALISLGRSLESSMVPDEVLPALARTIAAALELPYVAVEVGRGDEVMAAAVHGEPQDEVMAVPLVHHHEVVGRLMVGTRPDERLDTTDRRLLADLAGQAGAAAAGVRLTADLRLSRERLVTAREEKWRDVRHQLHDRLGPLDGILLGIGAAANTLARGDGPGTDALLARLKAELRSEIADIRALIEQLRPRSLDELGLVGALRRQAALSALPPRPLVVEVEAVDCGGLPSAVEVAAYQIVSEAVTNVRRHAGARRCQIQLGVSAGWLEIEVVDDGLGLSPDCPEGVGLTCMRERATELGGTFSVEAAPGGGTRVCVELPLCNQ